MRTLKGLLISLPFIFLFLSGCDGTPADQDAGRGDAGIKKDGGPADSGISDDAGIIDGGAADGGIVDGGSTDGGAMDAGQPDGGVVDGGAPDAGTADGGVIDGGNTDGGTTDGGSSDSGVPDGGQCTPENNNAFCNRLGKNCDSVTAPDNCGTGRTVNCGNCSNGFSCQVNVCTCLSAIVCNSNCCPNSTDVCYNSACCVKFNQTAECAGKCGFVSDGCGGLYNCGTCPDGGTTDGGVPDGGVADGGAADSGIVDGGTADGGTVDGGVADGGTLDGGNVDGGLADGGALDAGQPDGGTMDSGIADGGTADGGTVDGGANACTGKNCGQKVGSQPCFEQTCPSGQECRYDPANNTQVKCIACNPTGKGEYEACSYPATGAKDGECNCGLNCISLYQLSGGVTLSGPCLNDCYRTYGKCDTDYQCLALTFNAPDNRKVADCYRVAELNVPATDFSIALSANCGSIAVSAWAASYTMGAAAYTFDYIGACIFTGSSGTYIYISLFGGDNTDVMEADFLLAPADITLGQKTFGWLSSGNPTDFEHDHWHYTGSTMDHGDVVSFGLEGFLNLKTVSDGANAGSVLTGTIGGATNGKATMVYYPMVLCDDASGVPQSCN